MKSHPIYRNLLITEEGKVFNTEKNIKNPLGNPVEMKGCRTKFGYRQIHLRGKSLHVHSLVLETFSGIREHGMQCCHNDGNPANNHISNLRWGTAKDNANDAVKHGTSTGFKNRGRKLTEAQKLKISIAKKGHNHAKKGIEAHNNVLSENDVISLREEWASGMKDGAKRSSISMRSLGRKYGVTHEMIRKIIRRESWTHI